MQACAHAALLGAAASAAGLPAQPDFGPAVHVFSPSDRDTQARIDQIFVESERGQFGPGRHAFLFKPGRYELDVKVGFYTQVAGLGRSPDDVAITGAVRSTSRWMRRNNATCNFWRAAENLSVTPTIEGDANIWAVSQGTALRRVHINGDLNLSDGGWSSGGFIADCVIDGRVNSGSQQQWFSRNAEWGSWKGGNWNMVFVGTTNPPQGEWPERPYTVVEATPVSREKPFLFVDERDEYFVMVPALAQKGSRGTTWRGGGAIGGAVPIDQFLVARADRDDAASINAALEAGKHVLLTPGVYRLSGSLKVQRAGTIVLGLGYPTLVVQDGSSAIEIADVDGVKVGGILVEAGEKESASLVRVGVAGGSLSHAKDPIFLYDLYCRAGGAALGSATAMLTIDASDVVCDNLWLWRADHGNGAGWEKSRNRNGLVVNGSNVTIYGLFVEHCQEYQTVWNGERGRVYFYQSEMPYDPPSQEEWSHDGVRGFASYKVGKDVKEHEAWGLGVYCVFRGAPVIADTAIEAPDVPGVRFHHMITVRLEGLEGSGIGHVLNGRGAAVITEKTAKLK